MVVLAEKAKLGITFLYNEKIFNSCMLVNQLICYGAKNRYRIS